MPFSNFFSRTSGSVGGGKGVPGNQATSKDVIALGGDLVILRKCVKMFTFSKKTRFLEPQSLPEFGVRLPKETVRGGIPGHCSWRLS